MFASDEHQVEFWRCAIGTRGWMYLDEIFGATSIDAGTGEAQTTKNHAEHVVAAFYRRCAASMTSNMAHCSWFYRTGVHDDCACA